MRDKLKTQLMISKGVITNYEQDVIPNEKDTERRFKIIDIIEELKGDLAMAEFCLFNGYDMEVIINHYNNLASFITRLREV